MICTYIHACVHIHIRYMLSPSELTVEPNFIQFGGIWTTKTALFPSKESRFDGALLENYLFHRKRWRPLKQRPGAPQNNHFFGNLWRLLLKNQLLEKHVFPGQRCCFQWHAFKNCGFVRFLFVVMFFQRRLPHEKVFQSIILS